ncbi:rhodanese-like domain-containing protein [Denitratisoma sp. agr-D3]
MSNQAVDAILQKAEQRAREAGLPYRGAVTPQEAWELVQHLPNTRLVDVRSKAEWQLIGRIPGAIEVEFKFFPDWKPNGSFIDDLQRQLRLDDNVLFLCRSGVRSDAAAKALLAEGFNSVFNVLEGFEGDLDENKHRLKNGWKNSGLPWTQG